jgi:hypothetical protein
MPDREKVIKALTECIFLHEHLDDDAGCFECPYRPDEKGTCPTMIPFLKDVLELLKEQPEIVRCKDCKNAVVYDDNEVICAHIDSNGNDKHSIDWFCGDGERR